MGFRNVPGWTYHGASTGLFQLKVASWTRRWASLIPALVLPRCNASAARRYQHHFACIKKNTHYSFFYKKTRHFANGMATAEQSRLKTGAAKGRHVQLKGD